MLALTLEVILSLLCERLIRDIHLHPKNENNNRSGGIISVKIGGLSALSPRTLLRTTETKDVSPAFFLYLDDARTTI
jgi:hypothetical protein